MYAYLNLSLSRYFCTLVNEEKKKTILNASCDTFYGTHSLIVQALLVFWMLNCSTTKLVLLKSFYFKMMLI